MSESKKQMRRRVGSVSLASGIMADLPGQAEPKPELAPEHFDAAWRVTEANVQSAARLLKHIEHVAKHETDAAEKEVALYADDLKGFPRIALEGVGAPWLRVATLGQKTAAERQARAKAFRDEVEDPLRISLEPVNAMFSKTEKTVSKTFLPFRDAFAKTQKSKAAYFKALKGKNPQDTAKAKKAYLEDIKETNDAMDVFLKGAQALGEELAAINTKCSHVLNTYVPLYCKYTAGFFDSANTAFAPLVASPPVVRMPQIHEFINTVHERDLGVMFMPTTHVEFEETERQSIGFSKFLDNQQSSRFFTRPSGKVSMLTVNSGSGRFRAATVPEPESPNENADADCVLGASLERLMEWQHDAYPSVSVPVPFVFIVDSMMQRREDLRNAMSLVVEKDEIELYAAMLRAPIRFPNPFTGRNGSSDNFLVIEGANLSTFVSLLCSVLGALPTPLIPQEAEHHLSKNITKTGAEFVECIPQCGMPEVHQNTFLYLMAFFKSTTDFMDSQQINIMQKMLSSYFFSDTGKGSGVALMRTRLVRHFFANLPTFDELHLDTMISSWPDGKPYDGKGFPVVMAAKFFNVFPTLKTMPFAAVKLRETSSFISSKIKTRTAKKVEKLQGGISHDIKTLLSLEEQIRSLFRTCSTKDEALVLIKWLEVLTIGIQTVDDSLLLCDASRFKSADELAESEQYVKPRDFIVPMQLALALAEEETKEIESLAMKHVNEAHKKLVFCENILPGMKNIMKLKAFKMQIESVILCAVSKKKGEETESFIIEKDAKNDTPLGKLMLKRRIAMETLRFQNQVLLDRCKESKENDFVIAVFVNSAKKFVAFERAAGKLLKAQGIELANPPSAPKHLPRDPNQRRLTITDYYLSLTKEVMHTIEQKSDLSEEILTELGQLMEHM